MKSTLLAAGAAVVVQPLVFAAWFLAPLVLSDGSVSRSQWAEIAMLLSWVVIVASIIVSVVGVPMFHLLRANHLAKPHYLALVGFLCVALPLALLNFPSSSAGSSSSATWHGLFVELENQGHVTVYGWLTYIENFVVYGMHGLIGTLVFGFVWQRVAVQQAVQPEVPASGRSSG